MHLHFAQGITFKKIESIVKRSYCVYWPAFDQLALIKLATLSVISILLRSAIVAIKRISATPVYCRMITKVATGRSRRVVIVGRAV